ncbi:MAG: hypothetical protein ACRC7S_08010 [Cetobacterium sp.]
MMKRYVCHKTVHAVPMKRGAYNVLRGWEMPKDENAEDEGYMVVYSKGEPEEYVSWSPKAVFERGYSELV